MTAEGLKIVVSNRKSFDGALLSPKPTKKGGGNSPTSPTGPASYFLLKGGKPKLCTSTEFNEFLEKVFSSGKCHHVSLLAFLIN
jgi:hypothetical protein